MSCQAKHDENLSEGLLSEAKPVWKGRILHDSKYGLQSSGKGNTEMVRSVVVAGVGGGGWEVNRWNTEHQNHL